MSFPGVAVVSCDIEGHSSSAADDQLARVADINGIVSVAIGSAAPGEVLWFSGGDGGHVVFLQEDWHRAAVDLIRALHGWARENGTGLRITGHVGDAMGVRGVGGRVQIVGDGINYAGWLLELTTSAGVVVSDAFRGQVENGAVEDDVEFHDPRAFVGKWFPAQVLHLMSTREFRSRWRYAADDVNALHDAMYAGDELEVLYRAKRLWQLDPDDPSARQALDSLDSYRLLGGSHWRGAGTTGPLLGGPRPDELAHLLRAAQLVERRAGEVVRRHGDGIGAVLVVLRGRVGAFDLGGGGYRDGAEPGRVHGGGETIGEVPCALDRPLDVDLVALTDVALLSFDEGARRTRWFSDLLSRRVFEHVVRVAPYLAPLAGPCELVTVDAATLPLGGSGIHVLVAGEVVERGGSADVLSGQDLPVLRADVPDLLPAQPRAYDVLSRPVKVLRIDAGGLGALDAEQRTALREALRRAVGREPDRYEHDVFLSFSARDWPVVSRIRRELLEAGLTCWEPDGGRGVAEAFRGARSSRFVVVCLSADFARSEWARVEISELLTANSDRRVRGSVVLLALDDDVREDITPVLAGRGVARVSYRNRGEFRRLVEHLVAAASG